MKTVRHERILELVDNYSIETQEELLNKLREDGFDITQATVSRDIKDLRLVKIIDDNGKYKYSSDMNSDENFRYNLLKRLSYSIKSISSSGDIIVIKTSSGMAQAVCATIDSMENKGILGTIAGDDTIFILAGDQETLSNFVLEIKKLISN